MALRCGKVTVRANHRAGQTATD